MTPDALILMCVAIGGVAFLYSSVGHAGASGYIAVMSLASMEPVVIKPTALILNILVATIAICQFASKGHFSWKLFWPFALLAVPMSFVGGFLDLPTAAFKVVVGLVLILSALRFIAYSKDDSVANEPSLFVAIPTGAGLGLLSGLTGTGGGIFLTPLLLTMRWATAKTAAGVSALFILANSIAGLMGNFASTHNFPTFAVPFAVVAVCAGLAGSYFGSRVLPHTTIKRLLAAVLLIAGTKLLMTAAT
ncbi:MAG: sulfite exporter TauE/SafE family protein [Planctomycetaceae bacterium]|nr:sulfite exporter TauE/SafE family protein [Planctomycetaceae bacterium]